MSSRLVTKSADRAQDVALVRMWAAREFRIRYRQSLLNLGWSVLQPVATLVVYGWLFSVILHVNTEGLPYLAYAYAGLAVWTFLTAAIVPSFSSIISAAPTISKYAFSRKIIPLATVCTAVIDLGIGTMLLLILAVGQGVGLAPTLIALPLIDVGLIVWVAAVCVFGSTITVFIRDVRYAIPVLLQLVFVSSPIMYPSTLIPARLRWINDVNPVAVFVDATRDVVVRHVWPQWSLLGVHTVVALVLLAAALRYLDSVQDRMVDVL